MGSPLTGWFRRRRALAGAGIAAALAVSALWATGPGRHDPPDATPTPPDSAPTADSTVVPTVVPTYRFDLGPADLITPGTVIGRSAPPGWSHLILKSLPRMAPEHLPLVSPPVAERTKFLITAVVADVGPLSDGGHPGPGRTGLRRFGVGVGTAIKSADTILSPDTAAKFGARPDWIESVILAKAYARQKQTRVLVLGPTMGVLDTPVDFRGGTRHGALVFRYAVVTTPAPPSGASASLERFVWLVDRAGFWPPGTLPDVIERLPPDAINPAQVYVALDEFTFGVPSDVAFAVDRLPPGIETITPPADLLELARQPGYTPETAARLEAGLRTLGRTTRRP